MNEFLKYFRCPQGIPVGAQCTLDLIQVCLKDREVWPQIAGGLLPPYQEHDLRFMYAMGVLRFLNHLASLAGNKHHTLYDMAAKLHIPDWVVNIRHDTSHGHSLPSLSILREATQLCLDWIHVSIAVDVCQLGCKDSVVGEWLWVFSALPGKCWDGIFK
jgi:ribosomal biogenesis protein LAS1